jgi:6-phosphogluconolactonase
MPRFLEILPDSAHLVERAKVLILDCISTGLQSKDYFTIVLAGGNTPKPLYQSLAREDLPWPKIHVFWGDERYVPSDDPDSNQGMARAAWLDHVPIPASNLHPMPTESGDPLVDALKYQEHLRDFFAQDWPRFDLVLLGMGDDGHTASLFPNTGALQVTEQLVTVGNKGQDPRITLTIPLLNLAHNVIFLVAGANKKPALAQIFADEADELNYPSRSIKPQGDLWWLLDESAGEDLKRVN